MYVANNSSILQYCHSMSIEGVLVFYHTTELGYAKLWEGGGGGNCEAKAQVLIVTPSPTLFPGSGSQKGGAQGKIQEGAKGGFCLVQGWDERLRSSRCYRTVRSAKKNSHVF